MNIFISQNLIVSGSSRRGHGLPKWCLQSDPVHCAGPCKVVWKQYFIIYDLYFCLFQLFQDPPLDKISFSLALQNVFECELALPGTDYRYTKPTIYSPGEIFDPFSRAFILLLFQYYLDGQASTKPTIFCHFHIYSLLLSYLLSLSSLVPSHHSTAILNNEVSTALIALFPSLRKHAVWQISDFPQNFHQTSFPRKSLRELGNVVNLVENPCHSQILCWFPRLSVSHPPWYYFAEVHKMCRAFCFNVELTS